MQQNARSGLEHETAELTRPSIASTWDIPVGILGRSWNAGSITGRDDRFYLLQRTQAALRPTQLPSQGYRELFSQV
jgi:hypothetical protein